MKQNAVMDALQNGALDDSLKRMYACPPDKLPHYRERFLDAVKSFGAEFGTEADIALFSAPGRTELCGNHTDHQGGHVLCGAVNRDIIGVAAIRTDGHICVRSHEHKPEFVDITSLAPVPEEKGTAAALLRGISARFAALGYPVTGFNAYTVSDVPGGSGLSSSAAFEVLIGNICAAFFAKEPVSPVEIARIGQYAENVYLGKPCGLMDQMASALGGVVAIDFRNAEPAVTQMDISLAAEGYALCILDSGDSHSDMTDAYAAVPAEMRSVAKVLGHTVLSQASRYELLSSVAQVRKTCGDRAFLRALHYFADDERVTKAVRSLQNGYFSQYLEEIRASGRSSFQYLQNAAVYDDPRHEGVAVTIALCELLLADRGAVRVHGGGFAGTVQAYVPLDMLESFQKRIEDALGKGCCQVMQLRSVGGMRLC